MRREHDRARQLELDEHARRAVLEGLEAADRHAELLARLQVLERHLEAGASCRRASRRTARWWRDRARGRAAPSPRPPRRERASAPTATPSSWTSAAPRPSTRCCRSTPRPRRVARHEEERDAGLVARVARRCAPRPTNQSARLPVEHVHLPAAELPAAAGALGARLDVLVRVAAAGLLVRDAPGGARRPTTAGRCACCCASLPPSSSAVVAEQHRADHRLGHAARGRAPRARPSGRSSRGRRRRTAPAPRCRASRAAPSRATARGENPSPSSSSRSARTRLNDDFPCTNSRAVRWRISCSSVSASAIVSPAGRGRSWR